MSLYTSQKYVKPPFNINQCIYTEKLCKDIPVSLYTNQKQVLIHKDMQVCLYTTQKIFQCPCTPVKKHVKPPFNINQCIYTEKLCKDIPVYLYTKQKKTGLIHKDIPVSLYTSNKTHKNLLSILINVFIQKNYAKIFHCSCTLIKK